MKKSKKAKQKHVSFAVWLASQALALWKVLGVEKPLGERRQEMVTAHKEGTDMYLVRPVASCLLLWQTGTK